MVSQWPSWYYIYIYYTILVLIQHTNLWHPLCKHKNIWWKIFFLHWPVCLKQFAWNTPPLLKPPSRCTCLMIISKLFFTAVPIPSSDAVCAWVCVSVVSVIVKCPVLPPCAVGGRSKNPLYYYYTVLLYPGKVQQLLSACAALSCVQVMIWLPVFEIFNMHRNANGDACHSTWGLY